MREIKFRAWNVKRCKWVTPDIVSIDGNGDIDVGGVDTVGLDIQFTTGLKDRNSKDIYDGDVVRYCGEKQQYPDGEEIEIEEKMVVQWCNAWSGFEPFVSLVYQDVAYRIYSSDVEIIGNKHQNPELLEAKKS